MFFKSLILAAGVFFISVPSIASAFDVGLSPQAHTGGMDAAGKAAILDLKPHSLRFGPSANYVSNVNWAAQHGIGVQFFLGYTGGCADIKTSAGRQCYANRSAKTAKAFGNKAQYYEVWNEWNGGFGLGKLGWNKPPANDAAMYTDLLCRTYKAIIAVQPNAIVVGGAVAGANKTFITGMLNAGAGDCMDMLSLHLYVYAQKWPGHVPSDAPASVGVDKFIEVINARENLVRAKTGRTIPILVSEAGFHGANEQLRADYVTELYKRSSAVPFIEGIWWYELRDSVKGTHGLLRKNNTKKPAFEAYKAAAARL